MKHRNRLIIYLILGIFVISGMLLVSYGYMGSDVSGNETAKEFVNLSQILKVKYSGGTENITTKEDGYFAPGSVLTKTFSIKNTGNVNINYGVKLSEVVNDFKRVEDLVYELYLEDTLLITDTFPNYDKVLAYSQTINVGETKNYTLKVMYNESEENQIIDQNKTINAKITFVQTKNTLSNIKILGNSVQDRLPSEYQGVEYIESTGTQYILTEIYPQFDWQFELKFSDFTRGDTSNPPTFFSTEKNESGYYYALNQNTFNYTNVTDSFNFGITNSSNIDTISFDGTKISYNGTVKKTFTESAHKALYKLILFRNRLDATGSLERYASFKLYSFKIFDGNNTLYDLIPCYRKSDNEIGLYDLINNVFYSNQGTGVFKKGNDTFTNNGTPIPTNPIEIESVGDKTVNLFEFDKVKTTPNRHSSYELTENGFIATGILNPSNPNSWSSGYVQYFTKNPLEAGTYTVSWYHTTTTGYEIPENLGMNVYGYDANGSRIFSQYNSAKYNKETKRFSITLTLSERLESFYLELPLFGTTSVVKDAQIQKGTIATDYEPFDKYKIPIKVVGKNKYIDKNYIVNTQITEDGILNSHQYFSTSDYINAKQNSDYTLSFKNNNLHGNWQLSVHFYDESKNWLSYKKLYITKESISSSLTFKTPSNCSYIRISIYENAYNIQLEEGTNITEYEEFITTNIFLDEPLRKVGECSDYSCVDYIDFNNKQHIKNNSTYTLTGNETFKFFQSSSIVNQFYFAYPGIKHPVSEGSSTNIISNLYSGIKIDDRNGNFNTIYSYSDGIAINDNNYASIEEFSAMVQEKYTKGTPVIANYILSTPIVTPLELPNLYSINPDDNIIIDTTVPTTIVKE